MRLVAVCAVASVMTIGSAAVLAQDPVKVDPDHYKVVLENAAVRVLNITYGVGEKSSMHQHPESIAVALSAASARFTLPDGKTEDSELANETALYMPAGPHSPANIGKSSFRIDSGGVQGGRARDGRGGAAFTAWNRNEDAGRGRPGDSLPVDGGRRLRRARGHDARVRSDHHRARPGTAHPVEGGPAREDELGARRRGVHRPRRETRNAQHRRQTPGTSFSSPSSREVISGAARSAVG